MAHTSLRIRKIWIFILVAVAALFVLSRGPFASTRNLPAMGETPEENTRIVRVLIQGMDDATIERATRMLLLYPGVVDVRINKDTREAMIRFDINKTSLKSLDAVLRSAGFITWYH